MIGFDEAFALAGAAGKLLGTEEILLRAAHRRVLAEPVVAQVQSPRAAVSTMDGYAVRDADVAALPAALRIAGDSFAGRPFAGAVPPASCVRVFTGAAVPAGTERVIVQEVVEREGEVARFAEPPFGARHIRPAGSDFALGDELLAAGTVLTPRALVAAAAADIECVRVARRPLLRVLSTGDELVEPGQARRSTNRIPESVSVAVAALAEEWGGQLETAVRLPDERRTMERAAAEALNAADLVVVTGGASVGEKDYAKAMFAFAGLELIFSKVAMKPGKPVWLGRALGKLVIGLPGNPTSALVTARLFLAGLLCGLTGRDPAEAAAWRAMPLGEGLEPTGERETFSRGYVEARAVRLFAHQDSSAQKVLAKAGLLVRRPISTAPVPAGASVDVLDF
ncbi:molybdopterin molybdotransferase MoeA [Sphingomonas sp. BN140010]|uniref:Molybdopterin molybdenumtransferase n=1 Tax=Sphingomonas arvum TaxID=2992113 RepID=A0ABT3JBC4_9SPHN|nr:molybdopterin molybdotransferase MoeA [Sphingomonas sp. BN140010]MCW3796321.1 molybdopterin molybdotransferase MoeA [Sphingomonas sp. BN140010]